MSLFQDILSKLQDSYTKETTAKETIARVISDALHTTITADQITVQGTTIRIKTAPTIKMAIMLKKEKLLASLQEASLNITVIY